jgi:hypothetical protein
VTSLRLKGSGGETLAVVYDQAAAKRGACICRRRPINRLSHSRVTAEQAERRIYGLKRPSAYSLFQLSFSLTTQPKTTGLHPVHIQQPMDAKTPLVRTWTTLRSWSVPQDGVRRYLYDIWQPLTVLVLTTSFAVSFFAVSSLAAENPFASTNDPFFCNADGTVQMRDTKGYKPFWDPNLLFTINVSARDNLSFTQAKLIDAVWDLGVGRGGQMLAAVVTYRVLRRSLVLTMESCTIAIPTVVSVCCQRVNVWSSWNLLREISSSRSSQRFPGKRLSHVGRRRLLMQLFACIYVLTFPTLASVMTGYRTGFEGVFGYDPGSVSQVKPLSKLGYAGIVLKGGNRVGLSNSTTQLLYQVEQIPFQLEKQDQYLLIKDLLLSSGSMEEPAGVLIDCKCGWFLANSWKMCSPNAEVQITSPV